MDLINEEDGLTLSYVRHVVRDKRGLVWIGTMGGVFIYDGFSFTYLTDSEESPIRIYGVDVFSIVEGEDGSMLITTEKGVNKVNLKERTCERLIPTKGVNIIDGGDVHWLYSDSIFALIKQDTVLYLDDPLWDPKNVMTLIADAHGNLIVFHYTHNMTIWDNTGKVKSQIEVSSIYEDIFYEEDVRGIGRILPIQNKAGQIEFLVNGKNFIQLNESMTKLRRFTPSPGSVAGMLHTFNDKILNQTDPLFENKVLLEISDLHYDQSDVLWVGTNFGLVKINVKNNNFRTIPALEGASLRQMYKDEDGTIYGGAYSPFSFYAVSEDSESFEQYNITAVYSVEPFGKDTLILSTEGIGALLFDKRLKKKVYGVTEYTGFSLFALRLGKQGNIWLGADTDLYFGNVNDLDNLKIFKPRDGKTYLEDQIITHVDYDVIDETLLWVANYRGLYLLDVAKGVFKPFIASSSIATDYFEANVNDVIHEENGDLWIATIEGLRYLDRDRGITKHYTMEDGLCDDYINTIIKDNNGNLWIGTNNGLSRLNPETEQFTNFYEEDGLPHREFNKNAVFKTPDGEIIFGGLNGLVIFNPEEIITNAWDFSPFISKYSVYDAEFGHIVDIVPNTDNPEVTLDPYRRNIEFSLSLTDLTNPRLSKFKVMLEGFDRDWKYRIGTNKIRYTNLDAGTYTFRAKAANKEGDWSEAEARMTVIVREPFVGSDLFFGLIFISIVGTLLIFYYTQRAHQVASIQLRNRISNDLHNEVSNTLNNIRIISNEAVLSNNELSGLQNIKRMSGNAIEYVQDVIWAIDQDKESMKYLLFRMEDHIDLCLRNNQIPVELTKESIESDKVLSFLFRRNLLLIFKDTIVKMVKHSVSQKVEIFIGNRQGKFILNCINYYKEKSDETFFSDRELLNMKQRAEAIGGRILVEDEKGKFAVRLHLEKEL